MKLFGSHNIKRWIRKTKAAVKQMPRRAKITILVIVCILLVLAVALTIVYHSFVKPPEQHMQTAIVAQPAPVAIVEEEKPEKEEKEDVTPVEEEDPVETEQPLCQMEGVYNILICGTDGDGYRTDTILIAHLDVNNHTTALLSIPRDTVVSNGSGISKINSVYAGGKETGMERVQNTLASMLGFRTDGYVLVDLIAFQKIVDLVGGVWFTVPMDMDYEDSSQDLYIHLKQGYQLLDGYNAMCLCRFRKGYASQDIQRTKVQQEFIRELADQVLSVQTITKIQELAEIASEYVVTDLTLGNMVYFAQELKKCDLTEIPSFTAEGQGMMINKGSYYPLFDSSLLATVNAYFNPYDTPISSVNVITPELAKTFDSGYTPDTAEEEPTTEETAEEPPEEDETTEAESIDPEEPSEETEEVPDKTVNTESEPIIDESTQD